MNPTIIPILRNTSKIAIPIIADLINNNAFKSFWFKKTKGTIMKISENNLIFIVELITEYLKNISDKKLEKDTTQLSAFNDFINYLENLLPESKDEILLKEQQKIINKQIKAFQKKKKQYCVGDISL